MNLTNLIPYPSMEGTGWSGGSYSTNYAYVGSRSIRLSGTTSTPEVTVNTVRGISLNPSHTYYTRVYGYQTSKTTNATVGFYWPIAEPSFQENIAIGDAGKWNLYSAVNTRTSFTSGFYPFRIDWNNNNRAGTIYVDGCMLIDLTAAFGAGNEPTKAWIDEHVPYFEGTKSFEFQVVTIPQIIDASFSPNPVNMNTATKLTVQITEEIKILAPTWFYSGQLYSGEV